MQRGGGQRGGGMQRGSGEYHTHTHSLSLSPHFQHTSYPHTPTHTFSRECCSARCRFGKWERRKRRRRRRESSAI